MKEIAELTEYDIIVMRAPVDMGMHERIRTEISKLKAKAQNSTVFLVLDTGGGDPMYAYRTMKLLDATYNKVYCLIPDMAMSAGTLMVLGSDAVIMAADSCLGPLDLQISHPNPDDDARISTLDVRDTASSTSIEASAVARKILIDNLSNGLPKRIAERMATNLVTSMYTPIMNKIDPYHMHESVRNADLSIKYGVRLLMMRMMKDDRRRAIATSNELANNYSYHGYAITSDEAKEIGLEVYDLAKCEQWRKVGAFYDMTQNGDIISISINNNTKECEE